jgi:hypothetical protein
VRVYLEKYTEDDPEERFAEGDTTLIIVPTAGGSDVDAYFDYTKICPPHCDDDEGD